MRLDAALAGALDAPRTRTSGWIRDGHVTVTNNGKTVKIGKSYKLSAGDEVVVDAPAPRDLADIRPEKVDGFRIVHLDDDIVVVDKPAGVAAHPHRAGTVPPSSPRSWVRASRLPPPARQNARHCARLDVGTSGLMVVARSERADTELKRAFKERTRGQGLTPSCRACPTRCAAPSTHPSAATPATNGSLPWSKTDATPSPTTIARSLRPRIPGGGAPVKPDAPTRFVCTSPRWPPLLRRPDLRRRPAL